MTTTILKLTTDQNHPILKCESSDSIASDPETEMAKKILAQIMAYRRSARSGDVCSNRDCQKCSSPHLPKVLLAVQKNEPIPFVLPAFPGKSPNLEKVLGVLPDQVEKLSLQFFNNLYSEITRYYPPGIKVLLCSDGRVFSDIIGMKEKNITAYQIELGKLIKEMSSSCISTFNLDDVYGDLSYIQMREILMKNYGHSLDDLKFKVRRGAQTSASSEENEANRMYCGITRFLFEDSIYSGQKKSRTSIQKESRSNAYEVIRRSNAWSNLIEVRFPEAVRLSIHPQNCGAKKLGICLIGNETWMTPWHGVAVEKNDGHILLKHSEAEARGAILIYSSNGNPSHYKLFEEQSLKIAGV